MAHDKHPMWRKPQHHADVENASDHVHWIELFYDLIHVVAIFLLGNYLSHHLSVEGFVFFAAMFIAIWVAWGDSSAFNSLYVSTDIVHRITMSLQICTVMFMAASIPAIPGKGWVYFAMAYAANRAITAFLYYRAIRVGAERTGMAAEFARNFFVMAVIFVISAWLPAPYNYWLFFTGIAVIQLMYMLPKVGLLRFDRARPRMGHIAERMALLLLIVIGEGFFKLVVTLSEKGVYKVSPDILVNFTLGGIAVFVTCWIYFDFVGNAKPRSRETRIMVQWWMSHMLLMLSAVMIGVALTGQIKVGFSGNYPYGYAVVGCIGLAVYLFCLLLIQYSVEERVAHRFATAGIRWFGIIMAFVTLAVVNHVPTIVGNLLWCTALFSQIAVPLSRGYRELILKEVSNAK